MKKALLPFLMTVVLTGCVTAITMQNQTEQLTVTDPTDSYAAAVDCASRFVRPGSNGQFFTYQSDKLNKFILTFGLDNVVSFFGKPQATVDAIMRYNTAKDGRSATLEVTDWRVCDLTYGKCGSSLPKSAAPKYEEKAGNLLKEISQCIQNH